jgi:hypothetical protein
MRVAILTPQPTPCPLCAEANVTTHQDFNTRTTTFRCPRCGTFGVTYDLATGDALPANALPLLSAAARQASERDSPITLSTKNWRDYAKSRVTSVSQKLDRLLWYIAERASSPGSYVLLRPSLDFPLFDMANEAEFNALIDHLKIKQLVIIDPVRQGFGLTVDGFREIEPKLRPGGEPGRCFVAMSFDDDLDASYFEGIKAAIKDCHCTPVRIKELQHNSDITDRLLAEIRRAEFLVADFTGHKKGVYYEAGFARALGREVIMMCRESDFSELHFDTNHMNHIKWSEPSDLREKLADRIRATILPRA